MKSTCYDTNSRQLATNRLRDNVTARVKLSEEDSIMREKARLLLAFVAFVAVAPMLAACYTTRGAGEDLSAIAKGPHSSGLAAVAHPDSVR